MKKLIIILFIGVFISCDDDKFEEMNQPTKAAVAVPAETLFTNGLNEMFYMMNNSDANINVFRLYAQYWAQTQYPDESQYNQASRKNPDNFWRRGFRDALQDLTDSKRVTNEDWEKLGLTAAERDNRLAIADICKVYTYAILADVFGAIPYSEALDLTILQPKYDAAADVYTDLIVVLDNALAMIDDASAGYSADQDPVYQGDAALWKRFGNSLKLKLAITIADVDAAKAGTMVTQAIAGGLFTSNDDNASISYLESFPNTNPIHEDLVQSGRSDYVPANTIVDKLKALSDPRLPVFSTKDEDGNYVGGIYGTTNAFLGKSHLGDAFYDPTLEGLILDYSEVEFLLAEAKERGFTVAGTAAEHYTAGITASMEYWGIADAAIATYLARPDVAYGTATGTWKQKIGTQQWIAFFNRGVEGWSTWRRLDYPILNVIPLPEFTYDDIPMRFIFPIEEATLNNANLNEAIQIIGGQDNVQAKVFWDKQ